jgi:hypothetical protein
MPAHDGSRSDQDERLRPPGPERSQCDPKQLVQGSQSTARSFGVQGQQLLTESQVFEDETLPGTESADHPPQEIPEQHDHGKNLIGTNPNSAFGQVTHFAGVRYFGDTQVVRKKFSRKQLLHFTGSLQVELIDMETCGGSHFLGRAGSRGAADAGAVCQAVRKDEQERLH